MDSDCKKNIHAGLVFQCGICKTTVCASSSFFVPSRITNTAPPELCFSGLRKRWWNKFLSDDTFTMADKEMSYWTPKQHAHANHFFIITLWWARARHYLTLSKLVNIYQFICARMCASLTWDLYDCDSKMISVKQGWGRWCCNSLDCNMCKRGTRRTTFACWLYTQLFVLYWMTVL